jgi:hypothetical protein
VILASVPRATTACRFSVASRQALLDASVWTSAAFTLYAKPKVRWDLSPSPGLSRTAAVS